MEPLSEPGLVTPSQQGHAALCDVPWRLQDVLICFAPLVVAQVAMGLKTLASAPRWLWVPFTLVAMAWMLVCPLVIAKRRSHLPRLPRPRAVIVETLFALVVVPVVMVILTIVTQVLVLVFGQAAQPTNPLEPIVGSADRFQSLALIVMSVTLGPIAEEMVFRGMLYNALKRWLHPAVSILLQAIAFGLIHPFGLSDRVAVTLGGLCLALYYEWRKTLLAPVLLHGLANAVGMALTLWVATSYANAPILGVSVNADEKGCLITSLQPGGAAEASGLRVGDVITAVGEYGVTNQSHIVLIMRMKRVGDKTPVYFRRDGKDFVVEATLRARPK